MEKIKIGIIGCGGIANGKHMPSYKNLADEAEMVAFCDIIEERAQKANVEYAAGKGKVFTDYKKLLKEDLDAVCVCTPNVSHSEITVAALNAGKHVICEKPMAINYEEAKAMLDAKAKSGKILTIGYQNRYRPEVKYLKEEAVRSARYISRAPRRSAAAPFRPGAYFWTKKSKGAGRSSTSARILSI